MFYNFPSQFVYWEKIDNSKKYKDKFLELIEEEIKNNQYKKSPEGCLTNYFCQNRDIISKEILEDILWRPLYNFFDQQNTTPKLGDSYIKDIWWNQYKKSDYIAPHKHHGSDFSAIYVVELNEENPTVFHQLGECTSFYLYNKVFHASEVEEGSIIIFPSSLVHSVKPCENKRTIFSFNIISESVY
jgi:hypothetical protein